jgi:hypothetical protein
MVGRRVEADNKPVAGEIRTPTMNSLRSAALAGLNQPIFRWSKSEARTDE